MNTDKVTNGIAEARRVANRTLKLAAYVEKNMLPLLQQCDDSTTIDISVGIPWLYVYKRDDLARLMTLAPKWDKMKSGKGIQYSATVDGDLYFTIYAYQDALPPTCKVTKVVRHVPAVEAHDVEEETVVCEQPVEVSDGAVEAAPSAEPSVSLS